MLAWKQLFIQRVRNSSLVERQSVSSVVRHCGAYGKANVGISNDNAGEKPAHRKTKVS